MDIRKLQRAIVDGLEDVKAQDIVVFNTEHLSAMFERVIIASGTSNRQTKALAASVRDAVKVGGFPVLRTEGEDNGEWIIVDCGAAVAHIMQPDIRRYYHLEELWGGKAVKMKFGAASKGLVKAAEPEDEETAAPARRRGTSAAAGKKAPRRGDGEAAAATKTGSKKAAASPAGKPRAVASARDTAAKTPRKGASSVRTGAARSPARKAAPAKSAAPAKTAPRATAAKTAPRSAAARKSSRRA